MSKINPNDAPKGMRAVRLAGSRYDVCRCCWYVATGCPDHPCERHRRKDNCEVIFVPKGWKP